MGYTDQASGKDSELGNEVECFLHIRGVHRECEVFPAMLTPIRGRAASLGEKCHHPWFQAGSGITELRGGWTARPQNLFS